MRVLAILPDYIPSTVINVITPLRYLAHQGHIRFTAFLEDEVWPQHILETDIIVTCRNMEPIYKPIYELARDLGIPMIYDLDDNLFEVPAEIDVGNYHSHPDRRDHLAWMLRAVQRVRVHSPVLREVIGAYNKNVGFVWSAVDWSIVPPHLPHLEQPPLDVVYATSRAHGDILFNELMPDLIDILETYGDRVRVHLLGYHPKQLRQYPQVRFVPYQADYEKFFTEFTRYGYAVGLAPMLTDTFHQCKTDLKFRDYAAAGAVGVYKDCTLYNSVVVDDQTGILVSGERHSWAEVLARFIENPALLEPIRQQARQTAAERYNMQTVAEMWLDDLKSLPKRPDAPPPTVPIPKKWWFTRAPWMHSRGGHALRQLYHKLIPTKIRLAVRDVRHGLWHRD